MQPFYKIRDNAINFFKNKAFHMKIKLKSRTVWIIMLYVSFDSISC